MDDFSLSPLSLFVQAGPVGKAVMALLLVASIWCWLLIVEGLFGLARLSRAIRDDSSPLLAAVDEAGAREAHVRVAGETMSERRQRVAEKLTRASLELLTNAEGGLANLAVCRTEAWRSGREAGFGG